MKRRGPWWRPLVDRPNPWRLWLTWRAVQLDLWVPYWFVGVNVRVSVHWKRPAFQVELVLAPFLAVWLVVEWPEPEPVEVGEYDDEKAESEN